MEMVWSALETEAAVDRQLFHARSVDSYTHSSMCVAVTWWRWLDSAGDF